MAELDYYKVLGVSREASDDEVRKAYKKLARQYHPDMKPNDKAAAEKFKDIQEAYSVLGDPEKREQYDRYGAAFQQAGRAPQGQTYTWSTGPGGAGPIDLADLFGGHFDLGDLFGGGPGRGRRAGFGSAGPQATRTQKGQDLRMEIEVPFLVAAEGGEHRLQLQQGNQSGRLNVKIPAGVSNGSVVRLSGQGHPGPGAGPAGDLLLSIKVAPHPYFRREGNNLLLDVPVTPAEAALGAKIEVPTLAEGKVVLTVPAGTCSGTKLRLRGKGVPNQKTKHRGDQLVVVKIVVPNKIDERTKRLYQELAEASPESPRAGLW